MSDKQIGMLLRKKAKSVVITALITWVVFKNFNYAKKTDKDVVSGGKMTSYKIKP